MVLYFAYGSNLDRKQMERRCLDAKVNSIGYLHNHRLAFTLYDEGWKGGVADVIPQRGDDVWGVIYEVTPDALSRLDRYEDYYEDRPSIYIRWQLPIITPEGQRYLAWVYSVANKEADFIPPAEQYLSIIKRAAIEYKFPERYLNFLNSIRPVT
jgi:gamma-glutamylcyclotransferase (GGCT)/AIG2-like uncharacterized protein YtfP